MENEYVCTCKRVGDIDPVPNNTTEKHSDDAPL
jgi:hypothetical protein